MAIIAIRNQTKISLIWLVLLLAACGSEQSVTQSSEDAARQNAGEPGVTVSAKAAAADSASAADGNCSLTMGWDPWEPYLYADLDGTVRGLDVELMSAIAVKAGCEIEFVQASWTELLDRLRAGEVDVVAGASETEARKQFAWFSTPYRRESFVLYVRDTEASKYPSTVIADVLSEGMKIGVVSDYVYGDEINQLMDSENFSDQFIEVPISELNYVSLLDYSIDGFLEDPFVAATILRKKGYEEDIEAHPLLIDGGAVHFMFSKASVSEATVQNLNEAMSNLIADGSYQSILDKYRL